MAPRSLAALSLGLTLLAAAVQAAGPARLTAAQVRGFVQRQERAWNARDLAAFFALYASDAVFTDQARTPKGEVVPYGTSTVAQARAQAQRVFARARVRQQSLVDRVEIAPDGRSARVLGREVSRIETAGRARSQCAETVQTVVLAAGRLVSRGQTATAVRCRAAGAQRASAAAPPR